MKRNPKAETIPFTGKMPKMPERTKFWCRKEGKCEGCQGTFTKYPFHEGVIKSCFVDIREKENVRTRVEIGDNSW